MKAIVVIFLMSFAFQSFALEAEGKIVTSEKFEELMSSEKSMYNPWRTSSTVCHAATRCPNGRVAMCKVYGFNYSTIPATMTNSCAWAVWPGRGVRCQGYTQVRDFYGRFIWTYVDVPVSCF